MWHYLLERLVLTMPHHTMPLTELFSPFLIIISAKCTVWYIDCCFFVTKPPKACYKASGSQHRETSKLLMDNDSKNTKRPTKSCKALGRDLRQLKKNDLTIKLDAKG